MMLPGATARQGKREEGGEGEGEEEEDAGELAGLLDDLGGPRSAAAAAAAARTRIARPAAHPHALVGCPRVKRIAVQPQADGTLPTLRAFLRSSSGAHTRLYRMRRPVIFTGLVEEWKVCDRWPPRLC